MQSPRNALMGVGVLVASLSAQTAPGIYTVNGASNYEKDTYLTGTATGLGGITKPAAIWSGSGRNVVQVHTTKSDPTLTKGQYTMALTTYNLAAHYRGNAYTGQSVILGKYDISGASPVFTPTTLASKMNNPSGGTFGLMLEPHRGQYAAVDWSTGVMISYRSNPIGAFPTPIKPTGFALPIWADPAPAFVDGKLYLFWAGSGIIYRAPLTPTITNGSLTAISVGAQQTVCTQATAHSPTPIIDAAGNAQGLWMAIRTGNDSDMFFLPGLTTTDVPVKVHDNTPWMNNGGVMGGTLLFANSEGYANIWRSDAAWMIGSRTPIGGTATITIGGTSTSKTVPIITNTIAVGVNQFSGVKIPGWVGAYGLSGGMAIVGNATCTDIDGLAHFKAPVPNNPQLKGVKVYIQALSNPTFGGVGLTNTASLSFY